jgi:hypothetical protein
MILIGLRRAEGLKQPGQAGRVIAIEPDREVRAAERRQQPEPGAYELAHPRQVNRSIRRKAPPVGVAAVAIGFSLAAVVFACGLLTAASVNTEDPAGLSGRDLPAAPRAG